jgi:small subunit ribosomal protein S27Ae
MSLQLFVKTLTGRTVTLDVESSDSVLSVKQKISGLEGIPVDQQRLLADESQMVDERTLADYNLATESTIALVVALQGGGKKKRKKKVFLKPKRERHRKKKIKMAVLKYYQVSEETGKIVRLRRECDEKCCPSATFMAIHPNRYACGRCGTRLMFA